MENGDQVFYRRTHGKLEDADFTNFHQFQSYMNGIQWVICIFTFSFCFFAKARPAALEP